MIHPSESRFPVCVYVFHLTGRDQDRSAGGETDDDGVRDEINQAAGAGESECQLVNAGEESQRQC